MKKQLLLVAAILMSVCGLQAGKRPGGYERSYGKERKARVVGAAYKVHKMKKHKKHHNNYAKHHGKKDKAHKKHNAHARQDLENIDQDMPMHIDAQENMMDRSDSKKHAKKVRAKHRARHQEEMEEGHGRRGRFTNNDNDGHHEKASHSARPCKSKKDHHGAMKNKYNRKESCKSACAKN